MIYLLAGLLTLSGGIVSGNPNAELPDLKAGSTIYLKRCKVCHGERGDGKTFAATALNPPPKNFTSEKSKIELTPERMLRSVTHGRKGTAMMPWKDILSENEIHDVVSYIRKKLMRMGR